MHYVDQFLNQILKSTKKTVFYTHQTIHSHVIRKENIEIKNLKLFQKLRI